MLHSVHSIKRRVFAVLFALCFFLTGLVHAGSVADPISVEGPQRMLVIMVTFPGSKSVIPAEQIAKKAERVGAYIRAVSGGIAWMETTLSGPYELPAPLTEYSIKPYNAQVDRSRVNLLVRDALNAAQKDHDLSSFKQIWISVGAWTTPGTETGYGMICLSANPGFLHDPTSGERFKMKAVPLADGSKFSGGIIINTENSVLGHVAHDLMHAMGGVISGERSVPCLYSQYLQSHPVGGGRPDYDEFSIYLGPWDVMSQHFLKKTKQAENSDERRQASPGITSFTRMQLGWFRPGQVVTVQPGETKEVTLEPLLGGEKELTVMIPVGKRRYILVENRQKVSFDSMLPSSGLLVLRVDRTREEGDGTVTVINANPSLPHFSGAPFMPGQGELLFFEDKALNIAIAPLAITETGAIRIVVTTPSRVKEFLKK